MKTELSIYLSAPINERINMKSYYTGYQGGNALGLIVWNSSRPLINGEEQVIAVWLKHPKQLMEVLTGHLAKLNVHLRHKGIYERTHAFIQATDEF